MQIHRVDPFPRGEEERDRNKEKRFEEEPGGLSLIPEDNENSRTSVDLTKVWRDTR